MSRARLGWLDGLNIMRFFPPEREWSIVFRFRSCPSVHLVIARGSPGPLSRPFRAAGAGGKRGAGRRSRSQSPSKRPHGVHCEETRFLPRRTGRSAMECRANGLRGYRVLAPQAPRVNDRSFRVHRVTPVRKTPTGPSRRKKNEKKLSPVAADVARVRPGSIVAQEGMTLRP